MAHHYILPDKCNLDSILILNKIDAILRGPYSEWLSTKSSDTQTKVYRNANLDVEMGHGVVIVTLSRSGQITLSIKYDKAIVVTRSGDKETNNCSTEAPFNIIGRGEIYVSGLNPHMNAFKYLDNEFRKVIQEM